MNLTGMLTFCATVNNINVQAHTDSHINFRIIMTHKLLLTIRLLTIILHLRTRTSWKERGRMWL